MKTRQAGFSLIELMIVIAILSIVMTMAVPAFGLWTRNIKVRTMAEAVQNGLRYAMNEAAHRNSNVSLIFTAAASPTCSSTASTSGRNWVICSGTTALQVGYGDAGGKGAGLSSDFDSITFSGLGRTNLTGASKIDITSTGGTCAEAGGDVRCLRIRITPGGKMRLCDPMRDTTDPAGCGS